jgi:hypothetical protein
MPSTASEAALKQDAGQQQKQQVPNPRKRRVGARTGLAAADVNATAVAPQQQQVQQDEPVEGVPSANKRPRRVQKQKAAAAAAEQPQPAACKPAGKQAPAPKPAAKAAAAQQKAASQPPAGTAAEQAAAQQPQKRKRVMSAQAAAVRKAQAAAAKAAAAKAARAAAAGPTGTGNPAAAVGPDADVAVAAARQHPKLTSLQSPGLDRADPHTESAAEAAGLPRLKSRPGRFVITDNGKREVVHVADVSGYRLGDRTGHHAHLYVYVSTFAEGRGSCEMYSCYGRQVRSMSIWLQGSCRLDPLVAATVSACILSRTRKLQLYPHKTHVTLS